MKKVLLTGATGFLGAYLLRQLVKKGYDVRALRRENSSLALVQDIEHQVEWVEGDITDLLSLEEAMRGVQQVYHAAAVVSFNSKDAQKMIQINGDGTANVVNLALELGIEKLLHVSSIAALGRKENQTHIDENAQWENSKLNSSYAISKFKAECEVWRGIQEGLSAVIINPTLIMGAGFWHSGTANMFRQGAKGLSIYPQGGSGFVDVRDVAAVAIELMEQNISGQRYIVNAENHSFKQLFSLIAKAMERKAPFIKMPTWGVELMWRVENLRSTLLGVDPLITQELARGFQTTFVYDNTKLQKQLNFPFRSLSTIINDTASAYKESMKNNLPYGLLMD
jgi:nucleoside-diphosphate-sugar epimerase